MTNLRITTMFLIIYTVSIISLLLSLGAVYYVSLQKNASNKTSKTKEVSIQLALEFLQSSDYLTRNARAYVATGEKKYKKYYFDILDIMDGKIPRQSPPSAIHDFPIYQLVGYREKKSLLDLMKDNDFTNDELDLLAEAKRLSDDLVNKETQAMDLIEAKYDNDSLKKAKKLEAITLVNDSLYNDEIRKIRQPVQMFFEKVVQRTSLDAKKTENQLSTALYILVFIIAVNVLIGIVAWLLMNQKVIKAITYISGMAKNIAKGNIDRKLEFKAKNELGEIAQSVNKLIENLENSAKFIQKIEEGDFSAELLVEETEDEIKNDDKKNLNKSLKKMRDRLKEVAEDDKKRNWANEGFAKFGTLLRENDDLEILSNQIVS
jgi:HAMP domain-containing protein